MTNLVRPGAGIIVVKKFNGSYKVLGLFDAAMGKYDIPKGAIDKGESELNAALRETQEECGITSLNFVWGQTPINISYLTLFIAETGQDPKIQANPHSGLFEHAFGEWMEWDDLEHMTHDYLIPALRQARQIIELNESVII